MWWFIPIHIIYHIVQITFFQLRIWQIGLLGLLLGDKYICPLRRSERSALTITKLLILTPLPTFRYCKICEEKGNKGESPYFHCNSYMWPFLVQIQTGQNSSVGDNIKEMQKNCFPLAKSFKPCRQINTPLCGGWQSRWAIKLRAKCWNRCSVLMHRKLSPQPVSSVRRVCEGPGSQMPAAPSANLQTPLSQNVKREREGD